MGRNVFLPTTGREGHIFPLDVVDSCTNNRTLCVCVCITIVAMVTAIKYKLLLHC